MAKQRRGSLNDVADAETERLTAVDSFSQGRVEAEPPKAPSAWVTPSIQLTEEQLQLLRAVAMVRTKGRGRVQISDVLRKLIEEARPSLEAEATAGWHKGKTA
jgi:hypothetical protein